jgi:hypothetical protein
VCGNDIVIWLPHEAGNRVRSGYRSGSSATETSNTFRRMFKMTRVRFLIATFLFLALAAAAVQAQSMFATLSGTVMDGNGAVIVGAAVTAKNSASGETRETTTNRDGYFSVTALPAATYEVVVTARGFEKYRGTGIALTGGDDRAINIPLKVGSASETVEVTSSKTELAQTESGEKSYTISAADLQQLTLVSRDATEIVNIMPGAVMSANGGVNAKAFNGQTVGLNLNGPLDNENVNGQAVDVTMDGGHTFDPGAYGNSVPVTANQDMISEVKILTSNFTADNAKGPVVVNVVTKSGGASFHGDFHFNARNAVLNSLESDEKENGITTRPNESYYYPGATIGGPVIIPGTRFNSRRSKLFFFDGYEYYKQLNDAGIESAFVMTPQMLTGDFSAVAGYAAAMGKNTVTGGALLTDTPTTPNWAGGAFGGPWLAGSATTSVSGARLAGCTITGGILSSACLDPNGVALMSSYMPAPTTPNGAPNAQGTGRLRLQRKEQAVCHLQPPAPDRNLGCWHVGKHGLGQRHSRANTSDRRGPVRFRERQFHARPLAHHDQRDQVHLYLRGLSRDCRRPSQTAALKHPQLHAEGNLRPADRAHVCHLGLGLPQFRGCGLSVPPGLLQENSRRRRGSDQGHWHAHRKGRRLLGVRQ